MKDAMEMAVTAIIVLVLSFTSMSAYKFLKDDGLSGLFVLPAQHANNLFLFIMGLLAFAAFFFLEDSPVDGFSPKRKSEG